MIDVAIMGHGVVGSGVAEILINHPKRLSAKINNELNVKYILDLRDFNGLSYSDKFVKDYNVILNDPDVKIVAEVMGGVEPAYTFVKNLLLCGKSVVTSNKELVAAKGAELISIAKENNVNFLFEASVGGGIPIIRPMTQCLSANEITEISGILNGTTNFILNKMIVDNMGFEDALKLAQEKGYAEKNPAADIEGHDACRKICILAAIAFGKHIYPDSVKTVGITDISLDDVEAADSFGYVIKLIAHAEKLADGKITAWVRPTLVGRDRILSGVDGVFNAVLVTGDQTGEVLFYGKGAGKEATASAVVADIMDCAKHLDSRKYLFWHDDDGSAVADTPEKAEAAMVRVSSDDFPLLETVFQNNFGALPCIKNKFKNEIQFITEPTTDKALNEKLTVFEGAKIKVLKILA